MPFRLSVQIGGGPQGVEPGEHVVERRGSVGCGEDADIRVEAPGVEPLHLILRQTGEHVEVLDQRSPGGFLHEGVRVRHALLQPGDALDIGRVRVRLVEVTLPPPPAHPPRQDTSEFGDLLYTTLRASSWWGISMAFHAVLLLLLWSVPLASGPFSAPEIETMLALNPGEHRNVLDDPEAEEGPELDPLLEMTREIPDEMDLIFDPTVEPFEDAIERLVPMLPEPPSEPAPFQGPSPGISILTTEPEVPAGALLGGSFGKGDASRANAVAARALANDGFGRRLLDGLRVRTTRGTVRVVRGDYDSCEKVLDALGLEHGFLTPGQLAREPVEEGVRAVILNCTQRALSPAGLRHIRDFVAGGGHLLTTDWCVHNVLEKCFPGNVRAMRRRGRVVQTGDETIGFHANRESSLLRGLPRGKEEARWWLEDASTPFTVDAGGGVEVLIDSEELAERYGSGLVAVAFGHGDGRVVHLIGHVYQREGNLRGAYAMQRLFVNFLHRATRRQR